MLHILFERFFAPPIRKYTRKKPYKKDTQPEAIFIPSTEAEKEARRQKYLIEHNITNTK